MGKKSLKERAGKQPYKIKESLNHNTPVVDGALHIIFPIA